jgi:hypothetical protein
MSSGAERSRDISLNRADTIENAASVEVSPRRPDGSRDSGRDDVGL